MPGKNGPVLPDRAVHLAREPGSEYPSLMAASSAVARQIGAGHESVPPGCFNPILMIETISGLCKAKGIRTTVSTTGPTRPSRTSNTRPPPESISTTTSGFTQVLAMSHRPSSRTPRTPPSIESRNRIGATENLGRLTFTQSSNLWSASALMGCEAPPR